MEEELLHPSIFCRRADCVNFLVFTSTLILKLIQKSWEIEFSIYLLQSTTFAMKKKTQLKSKLCLNIAGTTLSVLEIVRTKSFEEILLWVAV